MSPESSRSFHQLVLVTEGAIKKRAEEYEIDPSLLGKIKVKVLKEGKEEYEDQWLVCDMPIEEFIVERREIAEKYKIPNSKFKNMRKKEGVWYIDDMVPEKWLEKKIIIDKEEEEESDRNLPWWQK